MARPEAGYSYSQSSSSYGTPGGGGGGGGGIGAFESGGGGGGGGFGGLSFSKRATLSPESPPFHLDRKGGTQAPTEPEIHTGHKERKKKQFDKFGGGGSHGGGTGGGGIKEIKGFDAGGGGPARPTPSFPGPRPTPTFPGPRPTPTFPGPRPTPAYPRPRPTPTFTYPEPRPRPTPTFPDYTGKPSGGDGNVIGPGHDHHHHEPGMPFDFNYAVKEDVFGNDYSHNAISDGEITRGKYKVQLPDGRTQIVRYTADWQHGFRPQISYDENPRFD
ncbi:uncharacterized protein [Temnothorax longispinosus]|uniref:uncharacterized protein n=1 Tax=Temnothorax longispinosus TaxID=300112 RepID=UPI003A9934B2